MKSVIRIFLIMVFMQACTFFKKDEKLLNQHNKANGEEIKILYVGLGATTNDVIQVRKTMPDTLLWVSDKFNYLKSSELIGDTSLRLILSDTGYNNYNNKIDTIFVNIK